MASVKIPGTEILSSLEEVLERALACEQFIFDLHDHPSKPLHWKPKKTDVWDQQKVDAAIRYVAEYAVTAELIDAKKLRPIEAFLAELPRLKEAMKVVEGLSLVVRYRLPDEDLIALHKQGKRSLRQRLDTLTDFDDSE